MSPPPAESGRPDAKDDLDTGEPSLISDPVRKLWKGRAMTNAANVPPPQEFSASFGERLFVTLAAVFMGALALFLIVAAIASFTLNILLGAFMLAVAGVIVSLTVLVGREAAGRWRMRATIYAGRLTALLPRRRGFIDMKRERIDIALADVERVETRTEIYSSIGVTTAQQAYSIVMRDGARIELGADRDWVTPFWGRIADEIAKRAPGGMADLGAADGAAGFLLVAGQKAPDWSAPPLGEAELAIRNRRRARTAAIMGATALLVVFAQILSRR